MQKLYVKGGNKLSGEIVAQGAKNSALPILAATILNGGQSVIHNCPNLTDVDAAVGILKNLGCNIVREQGSIIVDADVICKKEIPEKLMREMRSSIIFLGAILARCGAAKLSFPGGCELGARPIDLHLDGLRALGAEITEHHGFIDCVAAKGLVGDKISLSFPSVGATENIMIAAVLAKGTTTIINAAREPEIIDLANYLCGCGAKIKGAGESTIIIEGVTKLHNCEYSVIADRIATITYLCAIAITGGEVKIDKTNAEHISSVLPLLEDAGCEIKILGSDSIYLKRAGKLNSVKTIRTMPYPGFPTDAQAPIMALMSVANGTSVFIENIFENRYKHIGELRRLGANIKVEGKVAVVEGVKHLTSASVMATDLRGGASLVCAGLVCEGETEIDGVWHIDRGYENIEGVLTSLGANIKRK
ncbi:MAG: UDP-N-acetylglucosamine 1-carboxyvinyltransferase [Oscillospiraceae bacterium]|nr:UDP-N-acetylglucosamine 1-carboxyvinyltransferase [Oscillospiraceae bacterium]